MTRFKKSIAIVAFILSLVAVPARGQGLYLSGQGGKAESISHTFSGDIGGGRSFGIGGGWMFDSNIGVEMGLNSLYGSTSPRVYISEIRSPRGGASPAVMRYNSLRVAPQLFLTTSANVFNVYSRFGLSIGLANAGYSISEYTHTLDPGGQIAHERIERKFTGGISRGYTAAAGFSIAATPRWHLFSELSFLSLTYSPTRAKVIHWVYDGQDVLATKPTREREAVYRPHHKEISKRVEDEKPWEAYRFENDGLSLGVNVGIRFYPSAPKTRDRARHTKERVETDEGTHDRPETLPDITGGRGWYVSAQYGANFPAFGRNRTTLVGTFQDNHGGATVLGAAVGRMFHPNLGAELGFHFLRGMPVGGAWLHNSGLDWGRGWINYAASMRYYSNRLVPQLYFATNDPLVNFYGRIGLTLGIANGGNSTEWAVKMEDNYRHDEYVWQQYKGGFSPGFTASAGVSLALVRRISFFTEVSLVSFNYSPTRSSVTNWTIRRSNEDELRTYEVLSSKTVRERETVYSNHPSAAPSDDRPLAMPRYTDRARAIGISAGVRFNLFKPQYSESLFGRAAKP